MIRAAAIAVRYMPQDVALAEGYTHHARALGVPCWFREHGDEGCGLAAKWQPLELLLMPGMWLAALLRDVFSPDGPQGFAIAVGEPIQ